MPQHVSGGQFPSSYRVEQRTVRVRALWNVVMDKMALGHLYLHLSV